MFFEENNYMTACWYLYAKYLTSAENSKLTNISLLKTYSIESDRSFLKLGFKWGQWITAIITLKIDKCVTGKSSIPSQHNEHQISQYGVSSEYKILSSPSTWRY